MDSGNSEEEGPSGLHGGWGGGSWGGAHNERGFQGEEGAGAPAVC